MGDQGRRSAQGLHTTLSESRSAHLVTVTGEMDGSNARELEDELIRLEHEAGAQTRIVLNLSHLTFIDSTGLAVILRAHARMKRSGHSLALTRPEGPQVGRAFELSGLDQALSFVD